MADTPLCSELQISNIESNKQFCRLAEKTQVAFPRQGLPEVVKNRHSHSYEVATSSAIMAFSIAEKMGWSPYTVDYQGSIKPCALLHDIGHPPLGHVGQQILDAYLKKNGLTDGFDDNNNTLVVIDKNNIMVSKHTIASVIKYPDRLYPEQEAKYGAILSQALKEDVAHFGQHGLYLADQTRTIACQIMDEADRNTYICSDLSDFLCMGNTLPVEILKNMAHEEDLIYRYSELNTLFSMLRSGDKTAIKAYFNNLKNQFNMNFTLTPKGLEVVNQDLHAYREFLWQVEHEHYIRPIRQEAFHHDNVRKLNEYIEKVIVHGFSPSRTYAGLIKTAQARDDQQAVLRAQRDMIAETTDWYVTKMHIHAQDASTAPANEKMLNSQGGVFGPNQPHTM